MVYSLSENQAQKFQTQLKLKGDPYVSLSKYFSTYSKKKSKELINFLRISEKYLIKSIEDNRMEKEIVQIEYGEKIEALSYLHLYQKNIKDQIMPRLIEKREKRFFVQMPTGAGKTFTALECVVDFLRAPRTTEKRFIVWLVNTNELAEQALRSFKRLWRQKGDKPIKVMRLFKHFNPEFKVEKEGVIFAGFDKLFPMLKPSHPNHSNAKELISNTSFLIIDEAHHSPAETYKSTIDRFYQTPFINILGLSATPGSQDLDRTRELIDMFSGDIIIMRDENNNPIQDPIKYLQKRGYLANLLTKILETDITENNSDETRVLDGLASNSERNLKILEQIKIANNNNEATLVFACTLDHVYALSLSLIHI